MVFRATFKFVLHYILKFYYQIIYHYFPLRAYFLHTVQHQVFQWKAKKCSEATQESCGSAMQQLLSNEFTLTLT